MSPTVRSAPKEKAFILVSSFFLDFKKIPLSETVTSVRKCILPGIKVVKSTLGLKFQIPHLFLANAKWREEPMNLH